ncbi:MAG: hypothetical protein HY748_08560 [Elusimicrobia bacterium]|nr:hypothetical protein [Elusimicrobiota bacterium]
MSGAATQRNAIFLTHREATGKGRSSPKAPAVLLSPEGAPADAFRWEKLPRPVQNSHDARERLKACS